MEVGYEVGARRLGASLIIEALKDLEYPKESDRFYYVKLENREAAYNWFQQRSDKPMGYLWCLSLSSANGSQIRKAVNYLYHEKGKFLRIRLKRF